MLLAVSSFRHLATVFAKMEDGLTKNRHFLEFRKMNGPTKTSPSLYFKIVMIVMTFAPILPMILCAANGARADDKGGAITEKELVRRTQELYDAVVAGNQEPWREYFVDDAIFSDEKGRTMDKTKLIADITPLPAGYSGTIKLENVQSRIYPNVAIVSCDANEIETIFAQELHARYHVTDTWLRRDATWQIIASQAHRYYEDPAAGRADVKKFAEFVGTYELRANAEYSG
jgi:Domain of unknown function (DUF4440)